MNKPNILLIIADHQAWYGHYVNGNFSYHLPNFERFASEGTVFRRAYSVCPLCTPTRASIMSGLYPSSHGLRWNTENRYLENRQEFRKGQKLYSHYLAEAGYRNAYIGKWHCGEANLPTDYGIEGWSLPGYGNVYTSEEYRDYRAQRGFGDAHARIEHNLYFPEWEGRTIRLHDPSPFKFSKGSGILQGPREAHEEHFVAALAASELRELAKGNGPFSLVASFWGPHQPYYPSEPFAGEIDPREIPEYPSFRDDLAGKPLKHYVHRDLVHRSSTKWPEWGVWQQVLARCYEQAIQLDAAVGTLLDELEALNLDKNTLVIWCADHGDAVASHGGLWDKDSTYTEEVGRVPLAVRWPEALPPGVLVDRLVSNMDVTATILDAAGALGPTHLDSRTLLPLCRSRGSSPWADQLVCEHNGHAYNNLQRIILFEDFKYIISLYEAEELYDLNRDPWEMRNLAAEGRYSATKKELRRRLLRHAERIGDELGRSLHDTAVS